MAAVGSPSSGSQARTNAQRPGALPHRELIGKTMACPPPSPRQRIPSRPTDAGERFKPRGLLPRLYSRLLIALIVTWMVLVIVHIWS